MPPDPAVATDAHLQRRYSRRDGKRQFHDQQYRIPPKIALMIILEQQKGRKSHSSPSPCFLVHELNMIWIYSNMVFFSCVALIATVANGFYPQVGVQLASRSLRFWRINLIFPNSFFVIRSPPLFLGQILANILHDGGEFPAGRMEGPVIPKLEK